MNLIDVGILIQIPIRLIFRILYNKEILLYRDFFIDDFIEDQSQMVEDTREMHGF